MINPYTQWFADLFAKVTAPTDDGATMRIAIAPGKNFPDMPPRFVRADAKEMREHAGIIGLTETQPGEDTPHVIKGLGEGWTVTSPNVSCPIAVKTTNWEVVSASANDYRVEHLYREDPHRATPLVIVKSRRKPALHPVAVISMHLIVGAYNKGPGPVQRRMHWQQQYDQGRNIARRLNEKGYTVFFMGDFNYRPLRTMDTMPGFRWLIVDGVSGIGVVEGNVKVRLTGSHTVNLHSDHDMLVANVGLRNK